MSTPNPVTAPGGPVNPFPQEEAAQQEPSSTWNPWQGTPQPKWYSGMGFNEDNLYMGPLGVALKGAGDGAAKGEELLGGLWHAQASIMSAIPGIGRAYQGEESASQSVMADARDRVKALTPDPATTGAAASIIHGVSSGLTRMAAGSLVAGPAGAAGLIGGSEAMDRYKSLQEQGVTPGTAAASAALTGALAGAGALLPAGFGSSLVGKILTGGAGNVGFGLAGRYADHLLLEKAGYPEMAAQQKVWDNTAVASDLILGGAFGAIAHVHGAPAATPADAKARIAELETSLGRGAPGVEDAALTANLALRDRSSGPGVAADPQAANAHQAALESATQSLLAGKPVQVDDTGVAQAKFVARPAQEAPTAQSLFVNALKEGGYLDEQANLTKLEQAMGARLRGETIAPEGETKPAPAATNAPIPETEPSAGEPRNPVDANAPPEQQLEQLKALTAENKPKVDDIVDDLNLKLAGTESNSNVKSDDSSLAKASRPSIVADKPWFGVDYLRDHLRFKTVVDSMSQIEEIPKIFAEHGVKVIKVDTDKTTNPGPWGWRPVAMDLQMPNGQMVEHYAVPRELDVAQKSEGHKIYEEGRNLDENSPADRVKLLALRARSREIYQDAWDRALARTGEKGSEVRASLERLKASAGSTEEASRSVNAPRGMLDVQEPPGGLNAPKPSEPSTAVEPSAVRVTESGSEARDEDLGRLGRDTGSTSSESVPQVDPLADPAHQAVQEKPQMQVPDAQGNMVNAAQALGDADKAVADGERDYPKAILAAINCFQRKGGG